jgi:hypothetical protein
MNSQQKTRFLLLDRLEQVNKKIILINNEMKSEYINSFLKKLYKLEFKFLSNYKMLLDNYLTKNKYNIKHHEKTNESSFILLEFAQNGNDELYLYIADELQLYYYISNYIQDTTQEKQQEKPMPISFAVF